MKPYTIGQKLRKIRELRNFTQEYVAHQLHISAVAYGKIERGETDISLTRLQRVAGIFEIPVQQLLAFDEKHIFNRYNHHTATGIGQSPHIRNNHDKELALLLKEVALLLDKVSDKVGR